LQLFEGKPARLVTGVHNTDLRLPGTKYPATQMVPDFLIVAFGFGVLP
jgi:hypothetical protein